MSTVKFEDYLVPQGIVSLMDKDIDPDDIINIAATESLTAWLVHHYTLRRKALFYFEVENIKPNDRKC